MPKINHEEYEVLKELEDKWEWIAREGEYVGLIFCFREKPHKDIRSGEWGPDATQYKYLGGYDSLFQFIQWEDEEPHNIAELIEEYEDSKEYKDSLVIEYFMDKAKEGEETEVKKNIEWLTERVLTKIKNAELNVKAHEGVLADDFESRAIAYKKVLKDINQLDEPETIEETIHLLESVLKENKRLGKLLEEKHEEWLELMDEINNQETLSQEWIDKYVVHVRGLGDMIEAGAVENLLVPKQEKVKIKSVWAEDIEDAKASGMTLFEAMDWMTIDRDEKEKQDLFARAWLDGYTVEEEQKYRVIDNTDVHLLCKFEGEVITVAEVLEFLDIYDVLNPEQYNLTEQEIKDYDERYFAFAVKVEELE